MQFLANLVTNCACNASCGRQTNLVLGNVEICFVQRQRLHQIRVPLEYLAHQARDRTIAWEIRGNEDRIGARACGTSRWHGRAYPETSGLIRSGTDHRTVAPPGDNDRFAAELRIIPLLDGRKKRVQVDTDDFADGHLPTILFLASRRVRRIHRRRERRRSASSVCRCGGPELQSV